MAHRVLVVVSAIAFAVGGCAIQRAEVAHSAQSQMIGLSKEKILVCMGVPANKMTVGNTEVWAYQSGNGQTVGSVFASGNSGFVSGVGVSTRRFCNINVVMTNDIVTQVNYTGPTGGLLTTGEQCAYAVEHCVHQ